MSDSKSPAGLPRRRVVRAGAVLLGTPAIVRAQGNDWPNRSVRYINPFPAGGATDTLSRIYCQKMGEITGQQWVVENRGGSGGNVGVDVIAKSAPDGYTLGLGGIASHAIAPTLYAKLPFDVNKDFTFVSTLWSLPNMLVCNLDLPVKTAPELIELLKRNPGKYSYGSAGPGTTLHLCGEMLKQKAGLDVQHIPYRGAAPAMQDLLAGQIHFMFDNIPGALAQYRPGKVRGLAVSTLNRSPVVPDMPALSEFLPGFDITSWTCVCGPAGLPPGMIERLSSLSRKALESEDVIKRYADLGATAWWSSMPDTVAYRARQEAALAPVIKASGARID
jgi:tripartite-type tricarboxylate transporter receptor subunit TctC